MSVAALRCSTQRLTTTVLQGRSLVQYRAHAILIGPRATRWTPFLAHSHQQPGMARQIAALGQNGHLQYVTSEFLSTDDLSAGTQMHLILLNYVLPQQTAQLWQRAATKICADGGANRLYDQIPSMFPGADPLAARESHLPDLIRGDLDSVRQDVQQFYTSRGVPFVDLSADQETTDLEKCLTFLETKLQLLSQAAVTVQWPPDRAAAAVNTTDLKGHGAEAIGAADERGKDLGSCHISHGSSATVVDCSTASTSIGLVGSKLSRAGANAAMSMGTNGAAANSSHACQQQHQQHSTQQAPHSLAASVLLEPQQPQGLELQQQAQRQWQQARQQQPPAKQAAFDIDASSANGPASKRVQQKHLILVLGALGGRLDHTLANLNTLYCYRHLNVTLWGDGNLVRLLRAGRSVIKPSRLEGPTCGIVPLARAAVASSIGLKWNLNNTQMCFRGLLSTSNVISSGTVEVTTDEDLLWITAVGEGGS
eukprot:GHRR01004879.1.p1 GENE.GHRR01004879.1~~GHRR01004879.1.p1  ORF type:complete len:481 (+),score=156.54 GHRR01004879.1:1799-3241(+)